MKRWLWGTLAGLLVAALGVSLAWAQSGGALDALATQSAVEAQATANAITAASEAARAEAAVQAARAEAAQAAARATREAADLQAQAAAAQATSQASLLRATLEAQATSSALQAQATATAGALQAEASATAHVIQVQATEQAVRAQATAYAIAIGQQERQARQAAAGEIFLYAVLAIILLGALFVGRHAAAVLQIVESRLSAPAPAAPPADELAVTVEGEYAELNPRGLNVNVVTDPTSVEMFDQYVTEFGL